VITLTEPQTWTTIGVLAAALLGMMTLITTVLTRSIGGQITSLRNEMVSGFDSVRSELRSEVGGLRTEMNARFETVDVRFEAVNTRLDGLDRDVQALVDRVFRQDRP
jgi:hypothetical protein